MIFCKNPSGAPFLFYRRQTVNLPPIQRRAAGGDFTLEVSVHSGRLRRRRRRAHGGGNCRCSPAGTRGDRTPHGFYPSSPISAIYLTNCTLSFPCDTNFTPKCSHSLQQFCCVLLLRTENVNVCVVCCRNIRMTKPLADYADRYARFQCPRSKGMSQLM